MKYTSLVVMMCLCGAAHCLSSTWTSVSKPGNQRLWIDQRAFGGGASVVVGAEPAVIVTGGVTTHSLDCCVDSFLYYPLRNASSQDSFEALGKNLLVNSTSFRHNRLAVVGDAVYSFGGTLNEPGTGARNELYKFCLKHKKWELIDNKGPKLTFHTMVASMDGTTLIVFGGKSSVDASAGFSAQLYYFDLKNKTWTQYSEQYGKQWPTARSSHGAVIYKGADGVERMAMVLGESYNGCVKDGYWSLDIKKVIWTWMPYPDDFICMSDFEIWSLPNSKIGDFAMIGGMGADGSWDLDIFIFNSKSQAWTKIPYDNNKDGPVGFRGVYSGALPKVAADGSVTIVMVAGCYQGNIGCDIDNQIWNLTISP